MRVIQRATQILHEQGIHLTVKQGSWGYYLDDPSLAIQRARFYDTVELCIAAAVAGERPTKLDHSETKE